MQLDQVELGEAMVLSVDTLYEVQVNARSSGAADAQLSMYSRAAASGATADEAWRRHASAHRALPGAEVQATRAPVDRAGFPETVTAAEHYARLHARGLPYGPGFQAVAEAWRSDGEVIGRLDLPAGIDLGAAAGRIVVLDGCFQLLLTAQTGIAAGELFVPVAIERVTQVGAWEPSTASWGAVRITSSSRDELVGDVQLMDAQGEVIVDVRGLHMRRLKRRSTGLAELTYDVRWKPLGAGSETSLPTPGPVALPPGRWLVLADAGGTADAVIAQLERRGAACVRVAPETPLEAALAEVAGPWRGVVHARGLDLRASDVGTLKRVMDLGPGSALSLVQWLLAAQPLAAGADAPRLWLLTRGSQAPDGETACACGDGAAQAPLWGFGRVVATELPALRCSLVDLPPTACSSAQDAEQLASRLCAVEEPDVRESQLALRDGTWYAARLTHVPTTDNGAWRRCAPSSGAGLCAGGGHAWRSRCAGTGSGSSPRAGGR